MAGATRPLPVHRFPLGERLNGELDGVHLARVIARGQRVIVVEHDTETGEGRVPELRDARPVDDWKAWAESQKLRAGH